MPTSRHIISISLDPELHERVRTAARGAGKSVSRFIRELIEKRVQPPSTRRRQGSSVLLKLCGLAHGELATRDVDHELYGR
ncbi:MAG: ribbon-helix-helix protein, CopG family [Deltaproteobacteria bacterium]|nr:ribbon-helix-helix protein, CopG family [Deltaproteobacteria bacterium]